MSYSLFLQAPVLTTDSLRHKHVFGDISYVLMWQNSSSLCVICILDNYTDNSIMGLTTERPPGW